MFALAALLILYAYHKGQLDKNHRPTEAEIRNPNSEILT